MAPFGGSGKSTFSGLCSAGTGIVNAKERPSGDQATLDGDSMKRLMAEVTLLSTQYMNS